MTSTYRKLLQQQHDFFCQKNHNLSCYAIVDWGPHGNKIDELVAKLNYVNLFENTPDHGFPHLAPWLVAINLDDEIVLDRLVKLDGKEACVHWLWGLEDLESVAARLRFLNSGRLESGGNALIRYFDRAVWFFMRGILNQEQRAQFIDPLHAWSVYENLQFQTLLGQNNTAQTQPSEALMWTQTQVYQINLAALPMHLFDALVDDYPDYLSHEKYQQNIDFFSYAVQRADRLGLKNYNDFMHYSLLALTVRADFDQDEEVQAAITGMKATDISLARAMQNISGESWDRIGNTVGLENT